MIEILRETLREIRDQLKRIADVLESSVDKEKSIDLGVLQECKQFGKRLVDPRHQEFFNIDPRNSVIFNSSDGKYYVSVQIQDGHERCGSYFHRAEAVAAYVQGQEVLNHNKIQPENVLVYEAVQFPRPIIRYRRI